MSGRTPILLVITAMCAAVVLSGCASPATSGVPTVVTATATDRSSASPSVDPAAQLFLETTSADRAAYVAAFNPMLAVCPFPTVNNTIIAPSNLDPCGPALDQLVAVTHKYQADLAALTVPAQYTHVAQALNDGLARTLTSVGQFRPVDHSRDFGVVNPSTSRMWDAHLEVQNAFSA